jgi:hypothetical protein
VGRVQQYGEEDQLPHQQENLKALKNQVVVDISEKQESRCHQNQDSKKTILW